MDLSPQRHGDTESNKQLTHQVIGAAIEVHKVLGPGLLESAYERALVYELQQRSLAVQTQVEVPLKYKDLSLPHVHRLDIVVENQLVVELKAVSALEPVHHSQLLTYLKISGLKLGLLINFNVAVLKNGVKRIAL